MTINFFIQQKIKQLLITLVKGYKRYLSPLLPNACRFQPTCSEYMIEAIEKHGILRGLYLGCKRIFRCNPWGNSGYDPVPDVCDKTSHKNSY
jgi:hypothetical protein